MSPGRARRTSFIAYLAWAALLGSPSSPAGVKLTQANGDTLELEQPARRVITLSPHLAELAFSAGAGDRLLATVEYSDFPAPARRLPRIGDAFRFDLERIVALKPDLIIGWQSGNPTAALDRLETLGFPVWRTEIHQPEDIASLLEQIARAAGLESPEAARDARQTLVQLRRTHAGKAAVSYFYQVAEKPLFTLSGKHLVSQGLAICGGRNIFADEPTLAPQISREAVLLADPDVLIAPAVPGQSDPLEHWLAWPRMRAVRMGAFVHLPADEISRATSRTLDSFALACRQLDRFRSNTAKDPDS